MSIRLLAEKGYPKWWILHALALIAAFLLVIFGEELSILEIIKHPGFKLAFAGSYAIAILLIGFTHMASLLLDKLWLLHARQSLLQLGRLALQVGLVYLPATYLAAKLAAVYFRYGYDVDINDTSYPIYERQYIAVMLLCLNGLYLVLSFWKEYQRPQYAEVLESRLGTQHPRLDAHQAVLADAPQAPRLGFRRIYLLPARILPVRKLWALDDLFTGVKLSDIACFELVSGKYFLTTFSGESLVFDRSLNRLMWNLPHDHFFRLERYIVVNKQALVGKSELGNSQWKVFLNPPCYNKEIKLSRDRTRLLKGWLARIGHELANTKSN